MATGHWAIGFYDNETQPANTNITQSTIVANNNFGDLGDMALTNNIAFFMTPFLEFGDNQIILAYGDSSVSSPVNVTFWRSTDETAETALALANYVITIFGGAGTDTVLDTALGRLEANYGVWNSTNTVYEPFLDI